MVRRTTSLAFLCTAQFFLTWRPGPGTVPTRANLPPTLRAGDRTPHGHERPNPEIVCRAVYRSQRPSLQGRRREVADRDERDQRPVEIDARGVRRLGDGRRQGRRGPRRPGRRVLEEVA